MKTRIFLTVALLLIGIAEAQAQNTAFTYQGKLSDGSTAANGNYDLTFQLFDTDAKGAQQGETVKLMTVPVNAGIFTVQLDFGECPRCFNGESRFLEIAVRSSGSGGAFSTLSPRQPISSTPYAVRSLSSATSDLAINAERATNAEQLGGVSANQYVQGSDTRLSDARTPAAGSSNYVQNSTIQQAGSNFNISGDGIAAGTLSANLLNATSQYNLSGQRLLKAETVNQNTFLGIGAGASNTTGKSNSLFGHNAGSLLTTGGFNSFFGNRAGLSNTSGAGNEFFGWEAGKANTIGSGNVFIGGQAGLKNVVGYSNTAIGDGSGSSLDGTQNTFIGAGADGTGQISNATAIGSNSLVTRSNALVLGNNNVDVGIGTSNPQSRLHVQGNGLFTGNVDISGNGTAAGTLSGSVLNATTRYDIAGQRVLGVNATNQNTFLGLGAGTNQTDGTQNAFFGNSAGLNNTSGSYNSFFGNLTGQANTTGYGNAFFGVQAGKANTTGTNNVLIGDQAGVSNTTGSFVTAIGDGAGLSNTTENYNTFIGTDSNGAAGITHATAIGAEAQVTQSNSLVLGSINGVNGAAADTNVGIGTTAPAAKLQVVGKTSLMGNVGIGTSSPITSIPNATAVDIKGDDSVLRLTTSRGNTGWELQSSIIGGAATLNVVAVNLTDPTFQRNPMTFQVTGNVGIGTDNPRAKLHVNGITRLDVLGSSGSAQLCRNSNFEVSACSSSLRYKTDLHPFNRGLDLINRLQPITFKWKTDQSLDLGFGAEDVAKVEPLLVTHNEKGEIEGVKYDRLSAAFVNAFKEQQVMIQQQQVEAKHQQDEIASLRQANDALNARLRIVEESLKRNPVGRRR